MEVVFARSPLLTGIVVKDHETEAMFFERCIMWLSFFKVQMNGL